MQHYIYRITNKETNEFYIGVRSCKDIEKDRYMGSSSVWTKQYILENNINLIKEILETHGTRAIANEREVFYLKENIENCLCVNKLFDRTEE